MKFYDSHIYKNFVREVFGISLNLNQIMMIFPRPLSFLAWVILFFFFKMVMASGWRSEDQEFESRQGLNPDTSGNL